MLPAEKLCHIMRNLFEYLKIKDTRQNANKLGLKFWDYVAQGYKPSVNVVLLEDIAAVMGVTVAATCMTITHYTGYLIADSIGFLSF
jgi:zinc transporter 9